MAIIVILDSFIPLLADKFISYSIMDRKQRHGAKVYGKKAFVPGAAAAAVIFAGESPPLHSISSSIKGSPVRCALEDVTKSLSNFRLDDRKQKAGKEDKEEPK